LEAITNGNLDGVGYTVKAGALLPHSKVRRSEKMCRIEKQAKKGTKAQAVVMRSAEQHKGLLKRQCPVRVDRRKHGANTRDSGRSRLIFLKNTIDKNPSLE
jgi:hypothetical protein